MRRLRELAAIAVVLAAAGCGGSGNATGPTVEPAVVVPPRGAVVDARQWGSRDVALARTPGSATVQVVDDQGHGIDGLDVLIDGHKAPGCDNGCYRAGAGAGPVVVRIGRQAWRFTIPASAPSGHPLLQAAMAAYAKLSSVALLQRLASNASSPPLVTGFVFQAPDRLRYSIVGGSQAVVIGTTRWDRPSADGKWESSPQTRTQVMNLPWDRAIDASLIAPHTATFFDLMTHAWFRVVFQPATSLPQTERMTGVSHFMLDAYSRYNAPVSIEPPMP